MCVYRETSLLKVKEADSMRQTVYGLIKKGKHTSVEGRKLLETKGLVVPLPKRKKSGEEEDGQTAQE